ncbi:alpha/beta-hydrolase [Trametes polyzona]|nr:alpha/beta-hydrolase [Trametes polyzona]
MSSVVTTKTVRSRDGTAIYAEAVGSPRNPHVVFIHEVTLSSVVFDELARDRRLTDHLYLVRYDLRCHGRSGTVADEAAHTPACYAEDFYAVVRAFGLHKPIACTTSMAAAVVADVCASVSPNPLSGAAFVAPLAFLGPEMARMATERMCGVTQVLRSSQDTVISARAKTDLVHGMVAGAACPVPDAVKSTWLGLSIAQPPEVTARVLSRQHDPARLLEAGRQGLPLLVLSGSQDALVDGAAVVGELRRHFRNAEAHTVEGGSHALFLDRRDEFVRLLLMFVGRLAVMTLMG